ncbi:MAG: calcium-transporting P-type ATPase, PMR1-type [Anaerolineales bacterium]
MVTDTQNACEPTGAPSWHAQPIGAVAEALGTNLASGLSPEEAAARLKNCGYNELSEKPRPSFWKRLWDQLTSFLVIILIVASVISIFIGEYVDAAAIMAIVVLNAVLGVIQESRAEEALAALKRMAAPEAHVIRGGRLITIPARELVPGDLVVLEAGNYVPADLRLVESVNLRIDEASLTGESTPAAKHAEVVLDRGLALGDRDNSAYMGTLVTYGRGRGIVVSTGMRTEIGLIADMIQSFEEEPTPLQVKLDQLGRWLGIAALAVCAIVFGVGVLRGIPPLTMFITAISLAIAAVPEGLPAVVTICLALGLQRMVRRHALLRKLPAVETLGSATTICSDKTGTLTKNEMTVVRVYSDGELISVTGEGYDPRGEFRQNGHEVDVRRPGGIRDVLLAAALCNDSRLETSGTDAAGQQTYRMVGDPTEGALVVAAAKAGLWKSDLEEQYPRVAEIPFDSERKRMTTIHKDSNGYVAFTKGAGDIIVYLCDTYEQDGQVLPMTDQARERILRVQEQMANDALRVLGVARRHLDAVPPEDRMHEVERGMTFLGLLGMIDPARAEVKDAIRVARKAGLKTVMITGDHDRTAMAIARQLDLLTPGRQLVTGVELEQMSDEELAEIVNEIDVFARVSPHHKVRIVEALKRRGHIVAMTGDGVNDAPALKRADIGVAMGITGTDVSKETADMVLTDDNYASIVAAIEEGRIIYSNIRKFVYYLLSCNVGEILVVFLATMFNWGLPLTAIQLLVLNLVTDGAPALALGLEKGDPDVMAQPPRPVNEPVINRPMVIGIIAQSIAICAATLGAFLIGRMWFGGTEAHAQTMAFATLSISELLRAYTSRSERHPLISIGIWSNRFMQWAVLTSLAIILAIIYVPFLDPIFNTAFLTLREWEVILPLVFVPAIVAELTKWVWRRADRRRKSANPSQA